MPTPYCISMNLRINYCSFAAIALVAYSVSNGTLTASGVPKLFDAVSFSGARVDVVDAIVVTQSVSRWIQELAHEVDLLDQKSQPSEVLRDAIEFRVLYGAALELNLDKDQQNCKDGLILVASKFETLFGKPHPAILELMVQAGTIESGEHAKQTRIRAAKLGCLQSNNMIRHEIGTTFSVSEYFSSFEEMYSFAMLEIMYNAKADGTIDVNTDFDRPVFLHILKGDPGVSVAAESMDGLDFKLKVDRAMIGAVSQWNKRYIPKFEWELDLGKAWQKMREESKEEKLESDETNLKPDHDSAKKKGP